MIDASVPDESESISDKLVGLARNEHHNVARGDPVCKWHGLGQRDGYAEPALAWGGPVSFARAFGVVPGTDHDFGTGWGPNGDQRVSLRVEVGGDAGRLYVYDPTWDEYAVIGPDIPLAAVENAFVHTLHLGEHIAVEDFVALLLSVPAVHPSPGPEL